MARSFGLAELGETPTPADLLARFAPGHLPLEPTSGLRSKHERYLPKTRDRVHDRTPTAG
jgi:hypothetical protein